MPLTLISQWLISSMDNFCQHLFAQQLIVTSHRMHSSVLELQSIYSNQTRILDMVHVCNCDSASVFQLLTFFLCSIFSLNCLKVVPLAIELSIPANKESSLAAEVCLTDIK